MFTCRECQAKHRGTLGIQKQSHLVLSHASSVLRSILGRLGGQRAKKVLSNSPGLVDFAIGLVNSVFNLPDGLVMFYEEFE